MSESCRLLCLQIPIIQGLFYKRVPKPLALSAAAHEVINPLEKRILLHSWLSACAVAAFACNPHSDQGAQVLESLPPPSWILDSRSSDGKQVSALVLGLLLAPPEETGASIQRLLDFAKSLHKPHGETGEENLPGLIGVLLSLALRRRLRQAGWTKASDVDEIIIEAQGVLETAAPSVAAALNGAASEISEIYANTAEPLVEWLCSRKISKVAASEAITDGSGMQQPQEEMTEAYQLHKQETALNGRVRRLQVDGFNVVESDAALWMTELFSLLMATPMYVVSLYRRSVSLQANALDTLVKSGMHTLFDFETIATDALSYAGKSESSAEEAATRAGELREQESSDSDKADQTAVQINRATTQDQQKPPRTHLRNGFTLCSGGQSISCPEKVGASNLVEGDISGMPSLQCALMLLFQRGAASASRAVAAGATLLAYSIIMQLGNALLLAAAVADPLTAFFEDSQECFGADGRAGFETGMPSVASAGKETFGSGFREGTKVGESYVAAKSGKRGDSKAGVRTSGTSNLGATSSKGIRQHHLLEGKALTSISTACGVVAHACVEMLLLVLRNYLCTTGKSALAATSVLSIQSLSALSSNTLTLLRIMCSYKNNRRNNWMLAAQPAWIRRFGSKTNGWKESRQPLRLLSTFLRRLPRLQGALSQQQVSGFCLRKPSVSETLHTETTRNTTCRSRKRLRLLSAAAKLELATLLTFA